MIIGIDPGLKGGIAFIGDLGELVSAINMPDTTAKIHDEITRALREYNDTYTSMWIEKSQPHRTTKNHKEGIMQIFSNGFNYGKVYGCLEIIQSGGKAEINEVYPISWKSQFKLSKDKQKSLDLCVDLYPDSKSIIYGVRGGKYDGIAEAILIAYYGYLQYRRRIIIKKQ